MRYVAGYVPFKLKKKFAASSHQYKIEFLSCLNSMSIEDGHCEDCIDLYTKRWVELIDRGGLFKIDDRVFVLFHSIEFEIRRHLQKLFLQTDREPKNKEKMMEEVLNDIDVQFNWSHFVADIHEEVAQMFLKEIVQLWLTIRGNSEAGVFLEKHKMESKRATKKGLGLRKSLKRQKLQGGETDDIEDEN